MNKDMTYEEWLAYKRAEEKRKTHGAEEATDDIYRAVAAIRRVCFGGVLRFMRLYFIPPDLAQSHHAAGLYGYNIIMLSKPYYREHGLDDDVINTLFHECCHAFNDDPNPAKKVKDTEGEYHLPAFRQVAEDHGGRCGYAGPCDGYSMAELLPETMERVRAYERKA